MWIGINDLNFFRIAFLPGNVAAFNAALTTTANQTTDLITTLHNAGARYILVPNLVIYTAPPLGFNPGSNTINGGKLYSDTIWNGLAAKGINFIPADYNTVTNYVGNNAALFGILVTSITTPACSNPPNTNAYQCRPQNYATPNADRTYFFADGLGAPDGGGHVTSAVQQIWVDYAYSLIVAPSQISFLAESAVKARTRFVNVTQNQIDISLPDYVQS